MIFKTDSLRNIQDEFDLEIKYSKSITLILVTKHGDTSFASEPDPKDFLVEQYQDGDLLMMVWQGNWRSDAFLVTKNDLKKYYVDKKSEALRIQAQKDHEEAKEQRKRERKKISEAKKLRKTKAQAKKKLKAKAAKVQTMKRKKK